MSLFTVGAGLIVLASTIWSGRYQRLQESMLLRTLGASRAQIWKILCAEYFLLGVFASATGIMLAVGCELGAGEVRFQTELRALTLAAAGDGGVGQPAHGRDRADRQPRGGEPAAVGNSARGSGVSCSGSRVGRVTSRQLYRLA